MDIGCNSGEITRLAGKNGFFAVGVDKKLDFRGVKSPLDNACLGNIMLTIDEVDKLPLFDAVLLLSVHHQLIKELGDDWTKRFVYEISKKANKVLILEFSALNDKYTEFASQLFIDNDETSVKNYADAWLKHTLPDRVCKYIGKAPESIKEPYRFLFMCE